MKTNHSYIPLRCKLNGLFSIKRLESFWHKKPVLHVFCSFALLFCIQVAMSQDALKPENITISGSYLTSGYLYVKTPIYDDDGLDEGIDPGDDRAGYITIGGTHTVRFWSFHGPGDPQGDADWYWVRAHSRNQNVLVYIQNTWGSINWVPITKYTSDYNNYHQINITKSGSTTWAEFKVYLPADMLIWSSYTVQVGYYVDVNNGDDYGDKPKNQTINNSLVFPVPNLSQTFSVTAGKYNLKVDVPTSGGYNGYKYSLDGVTYSDLVNGMATITVDIADTEIGRAHV